MYNIANDTAVRMQSYLDDNNNNQWVKVADIIDDGGWYADASDNEFFNALRKTGPSTSTSIPLITAPQLCY